MSYADVRRKMAEGDTGRLPCFAAYCREGRSPEGQRSTAAERIRAEIAAMGKPLPT